MEGENKNVQGQEQQVPNFLTEGDLENLNLSDLSAFQTDDNDADVQATEIQAGADAEAQAALAAQQEENIDTNIASEDEADDDKLKGGSSSDDTKTQQASPFTPYARLVKDEGILPNFDVDGWDGKPEGLIKAMQDEINLGIEAYKESFDPRVKWLADNVEQGVPFESLLQVDKDRKTLESITPETLSNDQELQKNIVRAYYKETTRFSDDAIDKAIDRLQVSDELLNESKAFYEDLKEINAQKEVNLREQAQKQAQATAKAQQEQLATFKSNLYKIDEIVPGVKVHDNMKEKIFKGLTVAVDRDPNTGAPINAIQKAFMSNPDLEAKVAYIWYATNGFKDFKVFGSTGKKSAIKDFETAITNIDAVKTTKQRIKPVSDEDLVAQMEYISNMGKEQ